MDTLETVKTRTQLKSLGVPVKSIPLLKVIEQNPGITNTELAAHLNITKQAISKHVNPLENKGIIANSHPHPLWKAWTIQNHEVRQLIVKLLPGSQNGVQG